MVQVIGMEGQGARARVILVVRECIWNALVVLLGLPIHILMTVSRFHAGYMEGELKPTTFFSLLLFRVLLSFLFYHPPPSDILPSGQ